MNVMVLGSGLMGPAAAFNALGDEKVDRVFLCDKDQSALNAARTKLASVTDVTRLTVTPLDLDDQATSAQVMAQADVIVAALPSTVIARGLRAAIAARKPWVDLSSPTSEEIEELRPLVQDAGITVILGCGVEPGLTEILARYAAQQLDSVDELHIKCGGIPAQPDGPLNYRIVFGGSRLPLRDSDGHAVHEGELKKVPRYSGVERLLVDGVGEVEAWHENFMPWLLELKALKGVRTGSQKTVRWPGYADKVTVLKELGLLSQKPVAVGEVEVTPKSVVDAVLFPHVRMREDDRDITILRIDIVGTRKDRPRSYRIEMVDRFDDNTGMTSMARTTAFTGAIVGRMVARGEIKAKGINTPEQVITGKRFKRLMEELADNNVRFELTAQKVSTLR